MKLKKMFQGKVPENKILSTYSDSQTDVYSCDYVNHIVESGSNENGSWTKWSDGTMICDIIREYSFTATAAWGAVYESGYINLGALPQKFIEPPIAVASCVGGTSVWLEAFAPTVDTLGSTWFMRPIAQDSESKTKIAFMAKGKWK